MVCNTSVLPRLLRRLHALSIYTRIALQHTSLVRLLEPTLYLVVHILLVYEKAL